jgi:hypothetical protein
MKTVVTTHVGANGVLTLTVPLGQDDACKAVRVTVETMEEPAAPMDREAWHRFIDKTAGSITDSTFARHSQGEVEEREPLP